MIKLFESLFGSKKEVQQPIDCWRLKVTFSVDELIERITKPMSTLFTPRSTVEVCGIALDNATTYLEGQIFHSLKDGTLIVGYINDLPLYEVEIDLFELENQRCLRVLGIFQKYREANQPEFFVDRPWKIHGHRKDSISAFGFDHNGLFVWDRRMSHQVLQEIIAN